MRFQVDMNFGGCCSTQHSFCGSYPLGLLSLLGGLFASPASALNVVVTQGFGQGPLPPLNTLSP